MAHVIAIRIEPITAWSDLRAGLWGMKAGSGRSPVLEAGRPAKHHN